MPKMFNILIGTCGAPGASTLIRYVKKYPLANKVLGYDADGEAIGRFLCDEFQRVPKVTEYPREFIDIIKKIVRAYDISIICVCSSLEVDVFAPVKADFLDLGCTVLVSTSKTIEVVNNKAALYTGSLLGDVCRVPSFKTFNSLSSFDSVYEEMESEFEKLCIKPAHGRGKRGFRRILNSGRSEADSFFDEKPSSVDEITLCELRKIFESRPFFPEMLLMEEVDGPDVDTMALTWGGKYIGATHKTRERDRGGVIDRGELFGSAVYDSLAENITSYFGTDFLVGIQFKGDYLMEINPRFSSFIYSDTFNDIWVLFDLYLGKKSVEEARESYRDKPSGIRMIRYFDQYFYKN